MRSDASPHSSPSACFLVTEWLAKASAEAAVLAVSSRGTRGAATPWASARTATLCRLAFAVRRSSTHKPDSVVEAFRHRRWRQHAWGVRCELRRETPKHTRARCCEGEDTATLRTLCSTHSQGAGWWGLQVARGATHAADGAQGERKETKRKKREKESKPRKEERSDDRKKHKHHKKRRRHSSDSDSDSDEPRRCVQWRGGAWVELRERAVGWEES
jgi:hypothetical protein